MPPRVSIIIPAYGAAYLEEAITSVEAQTFTDWELIVVDDESPSPEVRRLCERHPAVRYLWQKNAGPSQARNRGMAAAAGLFVAFLDDDDFWLPEKLSRQIACLDAHPQPDRVGILYTGQYQVAEGRRVGGKIDSAHGNVYEALLFGNFIGTCSSVLIPRRVFAEVGPFRADLLCAQDFELYLRIARRFEVHSVDEPLIGYRSRPGQITRDPALNNRDDRAVLRLQQPHLPARLYRRVARFHRQLAALRYKESAYQALFQEGRGWAYLALIAKSAVANRRPPSFPSLAYLLLALLPKRLARAWAGRHRATPAPSAPSVRRSRVADPDFTWAGLKRGPVAITPEGAPGK